MFLHRPSLEELPTIAAAWEKVLAVTPHHFRQQTLEQIKNDPASYLLSIDGELDGRTVILEDGSEVPKLPMIHRYMWINGEPVGWISFRWQEGTVDLPPHVLGHIGYETFPWHQRKGYATKALAEILDFPRRKNFPYVELTTNLDNIPSQKVILHNGGLLVEEFEKPASSGGGRALRYQINL